MLGRQARRSFNDYKPTRHSEANQRGDVMFFKSLGGRRTGRVAEAVKIDVVSDASGCLKESVHEVLEGVLLGVRHFESCQLVFPCFLVMHSDQRQGELAPQRAEDFFHSCTRPGI